MICGGKNACRIAGRRNAPERQKGGEDAILPNFQAKPELLGESIESQIQFQNIDAWLTQYTERAARDLLFNQLANLRLA